MKIILITILLSMCLCSVSQTVKITGPPTQKVLVADETQVVASGKASFRIITFNDTISQRFMRKFEGNGMTKFTYTRKSDRHGSYWERSFYFKNESWNDVVLFINNRCLK